MIDPQSPRGKDASPESQLLENHLLDAIREGDSGAWQQLIDRYEGRLLAYVRRRILDQSASEDIVQETFVGFLISLPNYDPSRKLESYLFSICSYKLTDYLRKNGRRPEMTLAGQSKQTDSSRDGSSSMAQMSGRFRGASSIARTAEQQMLERQVVAEAVAEQIVRWKQGGSLAKLQAIELLFVVGRSNSAVAERLHLTQQQVANLKSDFLTRLKAIIQRRNLDPAVFPELAQ